jgi:hypothetical protein
MTNTTSATCIPPIIAAPPALPEQMAAAAGD